MKLIQAKYTNFRILKDFCLEFSTDPTRPLTVVRAANESGKTTLLYALQWGLFGDDALPNKGKWRLSPDDVTSNSACEITAEITFTIKNKTGREEKYKVIRIRKEIASENQVNIQNTSVSLFKFSGIGVDEISSPEAWLRPHLPEELREVFFTDGDRALSFIEGKNKDQSQKVEGAIRSLLGLERIENAVLHVGQVKADINRNLRNETGNEKKVRELATAIEALEKEIPNAEEQITTLNERITHFDTSWHEADSALQEALSKGNRDDLSKALLKERKLKEEANTRYAKNTKLQTDLFKSKALPLKLMSEQIDKSMGLLQSLYDEGTIPNNAVPLLRDRLNKPTCFCGESISEDVPEGSTRRKMLNDLIEQSEKQSEQNSKATDLFFRAKGLTTNTGVSFAEQFIDIFKQRSKEVQNAETHGRAEAKLDEEIKKIPQQNLAQLRQVREEAKNQLSLCQSQLGMAHSQLEAKRKELTQYTEQRDKIIAGNEKGRQILCQFQVSEDLEKLLKLSLQQIKDIELAKVSELMNDIFLEMIGASPDSENQSAIIRKTEIDDNFIIVVHANSGNKLNPSLDLNGASRRALTIAFILALTKISGVEAPNVIDTPLGMTSGYVKNSILRLSCEHSSQLIMLLTHDEISGCEEVISKYAGKTSTFTNPAHYPLILVNDPKVNDIRVIQCECDHLSSCKICERRTQGDAA